MKIERTKNASRNIVWGMIEKLAAVLMPFITRTVLIKALGADYLGLNSLFVSILQVLSVSELGIGAAIVFSMYRPIAEDDNKLLCALINAYRKIYCVIGSIILVVGLAIMPFLPKLVVAGDVPADINIYLLYLVYLFNTVISYYLFAYKQAIFLAHQRNDLISKRTTIVTFFSNLLQILVLLLFHNYYVYALVLPLATVATNLINAVLANRMFPDLQCRGTLSDETKNDIKKRIIGLLSFKVYGVVFASVDTIVISAFLGLTPLAIYNNYYYVQTAIIGFLTIFTLSITAGIGNKMITNSIEDNYVDFKNFTFANGWLTGWCSVCLVCLYQPFMKCWMGEELMFPFFTMLLMVLYFFLPRVSTMTYTYREAAGLWWEDRIRPLVATVVNLGVNIVLVQYIGMNGVILSTILCTLGINIPWGSLVLFKHYFKRPPTEYFLQMLFYTCVTVVASGVTWYACSFIQDGGWLLLFAKVPICCVVPNVVFWLFYRKMGEYKFAKQFALGMKRKLLKQK